MQESDMHMMRWQKFIAPDNETPNPTVPAGGTGTPPAAAPAKPPREQRVVTIQRGTLAQQMRQEREKGKGEALSEIEKKAKALGYASVDDMFARQERDRKGSERAAKPATRAAAPAARRVEPPRNASPQEQRRYQREIERRDRSIAEERQGRIMADRKRKAADSRAQALEAEMELKDIATAAGVKDLDYAIHLLARDCAKKNPEELAAFDEEVFFKGLRDRHPYIFGETVELANTGSRPGNVPGPPSARSVITQVVQGGKFDARTADKAQLKAHYRKLGLTPPS